MLYVIGTRSTRLAQQQLPHVACVHCHAAGSIWCTIMAQYFFIGFIPAFPTGKTAYTQCQRCGQVLYQLPPSYQQPVQAVRAAARTPLWQYSFLFVMLVVIGLPMLAPVGGLLLDRAGAFRLPIRHDIPREVAGTRYVHYNDTSPGYDLMQVERVTDDSVFVLITGGLLGPLTPASATVALRDSVNPLRGFYLGEWQQFITPERGYKRL